MEKVKWMAICLALCLGTPLWAQDGAWQAVANEYGLGSRGSLGLLHDEVDSRGFRHVRLQHFHDGIKVLGSELILHYHGEKLVSTQDFTVKGLKNVDASSAMGNDYVLISPKALPDVCRGRVHLARLDTGTEDIRLRDALNGSELLAIPLHKPICHKGKARTRYHGEVDICTGATDTGFVLQGEINGVEVRTLDAGHRTVEDITANFAQAPDWDAMGHFTDIDNNWGPENARMGGIALDIHWSSGVMVNYLMDEYDRQGLDGEGGTVTNLVHLGVDWDEAFYLPPPMDFMGYGDGGSLGPNATLDIVGHEMAHSLVRHTASLLYVGESSALDEGFADIFGTAVKFYQPVDGLTNPWALAEQLGTFRDLSDPASQGQPDTYLGENWYDGSNRAIYAHHNNGPIIYWFYLLSEGGNGTNDHGTAYDVQGIGIEKAEQIVYHTLAYHLHSLADFEDARDGSLLATESLYGKEAPEYAQVLEAWRAVAVGEEIPTGLNGSAIQFSVYPNPVSNAQGWLKLRSDTSLDLETISLQDLSRKLLTVTMSNQGHREVKIDIRGLPSGVYLLRVQGKTEKIIIGGF
jgi:Zn-dependent metalloprotease